MGQIEIVGNDDRGMEACQLSGETKLSDPWTFFLTLTGVVNAGEGVVWELWD